MSRATSHGNHRSGSGGSSGRQWHLPLSSQPTKRLLGVLGVELLGEIKRQRGMHIVVKMVTRAPLTLGEWIHASLGTKKVPSAIRFHVPCKTGTGSYTIARACIRSYGLAKQSTGPMFPAPHHTFMKAASFSTPSTGMAL